jgi:hypothetical protein
MTINRALLVGAVRPIAHSAAELSRQLVGQSEYFAGSPVDNHLQSKLNVPSYGGFPIVRETLVAALYATLSGVDHALSWAELIGVENATVSLATVARGAVEGLAKAYYLLSSASTEELIAKHISVTASDLVHPLRNSKFQDYTGQLMDNDTFPRLHEEIAAQLGLVAPKRPSVQRMVQSLLSAGMKVGEKAGPEIYSQLSGPAHASMSALGMYVVPEEGRFQLVPRIVEDQAGYLFVSLCVVTESWLNLFSADRDVRDVWMAARAKAESSLSHFV